MFCHNRPPFRIPDALDYTSLRMPNANIVTRLGRTFAKRSLLLRTKDDHPIVKDLRERRLRVQTKRDPEVGWRYILIPSLIQVTKALSQIFPN